MSTEQAPPAADEGRCQAQRCPVAVPPGTFMCQPHWLMVPPPLREALNAGPRPGRDYAAAASPEHLAIAQAAVNAVAHKETRSAPRPPRRPRGKPVQLALFDLA